MLAAVTLGALLHASVLPTQAQTPTPQTCSPLAANGGQVNVVIERGQLTCETALETLRIFLGPPGRQLFDLAGQRWRCQSDHGVDLEAGMAFFCISPETATKSTSEALVQAYAPPPPTITKDKAWRSVRSAMTARFPKWRRQSQQNDCYFTEPNDWRATKGTRYFCGILLATAPRTSVYVRVTVTPSRTILRPRRCVSSKPNRFGGFDKRTCRNLPTTVA